MKAAIGGAIVTAIVFSFRVAGGADLQVGPQAAQAPPATDVFLADLQTSQATKISDNPGYDNQPGFSPDGAFVLYTSNRDGKQTDIFRYDIGAKATTQVTHTSESEYSPTVTPDGKTFSVIRVEADGTQRLWRFDLDGANPNLVLENVKPVGYHVWIDATHLGLFVLGANNQPPTLQIADTKTGTAAVVATNIGRGMRMRQNSTGNLVFVSKAETPWVIKEYSPSTGQTSTLTAVVEGSEDFAWDVINNKEALLMARGSKVHAWSPALPTWRELADYSSSGVGSITRIAVRPGDPSRQPHMALVGTGRPPGPQK